MRTPEFDYWAAARDLIAANSVSANGNLRAVEVLEGVARTLGLETFRQEAEALGAPQANLIVHPKGAPPRDGCLLLVTHTDTVGPGPLDLWTKTDPFTLKREGDTLYGLGVADVKLDALAKIQALATAPPEAAGRVAFMGTFAEEVGCLGAKYFLANPLFRPAWASCGEPSELAIVEAHKGYLVARLLMEDPEAPPAPQKRLRITFPGKAAHSSTPHLGENAIDRALAFADAARAQVLRVDGGDLANKVPARCVVEFAFDASLQERAEQADYATEVVQGELRSSAKLVETARRLMARLRELVAEGGPERDERFDPATPVTNFGVLQAEDGKLELFHDARLLPGHDPIAIFERFEAEADALAAKQGLKLTVERNRANFAMAPLPDSRLRDAAIETSRALDFDPRPQTKATNTEGGVFASAGIDAIVFGPGRSVGNAHTANEWQSVSQLREARRWYSRLIETLCT